MPQTTRTAGSYLRVIEHRLGSDETELDHLVSINQAASILENARRWEWMKQVGVAVTLAADATYVDLPADVRDVVDVQRVDGGYGEMGEATLAEIQEARANGTFGTTNLWHHARELYDATARVYGARLELWPAQDEDVTLYVLYAARIPRVSADNDVVILPDWLDPTFESLCCAVAHGREEPELGSVEMRVAEVLGGRVFRDATTRDGTMQELTALPTGGAVQMALNRMGLARDRWSVNGGTL
jgi:hypothetical protein